MNKIERQETFTRDVVKWVARDGKEFDTQLACIEYESSAEHAIRCLYKSYIVGHTDEWELLRGDDNHQVDIVCITDETAIMAVLNMIAVVQKREPDSLSTEIIKNSINEYLFIGWNCDKDWCWVIGTKKSIIANINKAIKNNVQKANS